MLKQILLLLTAVSENYSMVPVFLLYHSVYEDNMGKKFPFQKKMGIHSKHFGMFQQDKQTVDLGTCNPNVVVTDNSV